MRCSTSSCTRRGSCSRCAVRSMPNCSSATCSAPGGRSAITRSAERASSSSAAGPRAAPPPSQRSPAALALLSGIACLGTSRQAAAAEQAAITLIDAGVRSPGWAQHLGMVTAAKCYVHPDEWGDQDELICIYSYDGEERHALVCVIDYNASGMLKDGWVSSQVDKLLDHCQRIAAARGAARPEDGFREIDPPTARKMLEAALAGPDR